MKFMGQDDALLAFKVGSSIIENQTDTQKTIDGKEIFVEFYKKVH